MSRSMTKPAFWSLHPAKTLISLSIHPVWSVFTATKKLRVLSYQLSAKPRLWSDWADAQADLSLRWVHRSFCWFCRAVAHIWHATCWEPKSRLHACISFNSNTVLPKLSLHDPKKVNWNLKLNFIVCPIIKHLILSPDSLWRFCPWTVCEDFVPGLFVKNVDNS